MSSNLSKLKFAVLTMLLLLNIKCFGVTIDENMNPQLGEIFGFLVSETDVSELIGKEFTFTLFLKFASTKHLIFHDAYIRVSEVEKYQIARWSFAPEIVKTIAGKSDIPCSITFTVKQVRRSGAYETMPHIIAEVRKIGVQK